MAPTEPGGNDQEDRWASAIVDELLARDLLELVSPRNRGAVETKLAHALAQGEADAEALAEVIVEVDGVADLFADDDTLAAILEETRPGG